MKQRHQPYIRFALCCGIVLLTMWSAFLAPRAFAQAPQKLRVGVIVSEPFVIYQSERYSGYSIDYWEKIAADLGVAYEYVPLDNQDKIIEMLNNGSLDVLIGAIGMTPDREASVDFSYPYFLSGLQILVTPQQQSSLLSVFAPLIGSAVTQVFMVAFIFAVIMAHVIYFVEHRGKNPDFQQGYIRDIWEAFWYLLIIVATGEYGDKEARTPIKRVVTVAFWLLGVLFIAQFTAAATSALTVQQLNSSIRGLEDLPGKRVVTMAESVGASFLSQNNIPFTTVPTMREAYAQLLNGEADAVIGQAPLLHYFASHAGKGNVQVVGPVFAPLPIGIALKPNSPLREPVNTSILKFFQNGTYREIHTKWFGDSTQQ